ncbi:MAG: hypothetical protein V4532_15360 [Pseudomonadota bacterium]
MQVLQINNTAKDLSLEDVPFLPNYTVGVCGAAGLVIQGSVDAAFTSPVTLATLTSSLIQEISLDYQYIRVSTVANAALFGT